MNGESFDAARYFTAQESFTMLKILFISLAISLFILIHPWSMVFNNPKVVERRNAISFLN